MLEVSIDQELLNSRADLLGATDMHIEDARISALRKMRKKIETLVKRRAAEVLDMPQRALGDRFFSDSVEPGDHELTVWVGTWGLSPFAIGAPEVYGVPGKSGGVEVRKRKYPGAFLSQVYTPETKVWIRLYSKHYSPALYPTNYRPGDRGVGGLQGRFPVVRAVVPIDDVIRTVFDLEGDQIAKDFEKLFLAQLNYQVNVRGGKA